MTGIEKNNRIYIIFKEDSKIDKIQRQKFIDDIQFICKTNYTLETSKGADKDTLQGDIKVNQEIIFDCDTDADLKVI